MISKAWPPAGRRRARAQSSQAIGTSRRAMPSADQADRNVALLKRQRVARPAVARPRCAEGGGEAAQDRPDDDEQGPDRGDADHAGAEEADLVDPDVAARSSSAIPAACGAIAVSDRHGRCPRR